MKTIDRFVLERSEAIGNYCEYFKANDTSNNQSVCIKSINSEVLDQHELFHEATINEIKFLQQQASGYYPKFIKALKSKSNFYIIMEYASGGSLKDLVTRRSFLREELALRFFVQMVDIVVDMRSRNVMHRHLKPSNVLIHQD